MADLANRNIVVKLTLTSLHGPKEFFIPKIKRVYQNMAILQRQSSQELLTLGLKRQKLIGLGQTSNQS